MWVTKLLISPVKKRIVCPKTTKFGPKLAFLVILGQPCRLIWCPVGRLVGGCGARAVFPKTPIYFISFNLFFVFFLLMEILPLKYVCNIMTGSSELLFKSQRQKLYNMPRRCLRLGNCYRLQCHPI